MLRYYNGTVFNSGARWLVNTVNCMGVMGAGIALEFRLRYPQMFEVYKNECDKKIISIGNVGYYSDTQTDVYIVNFPTKVHYKYPSRMEWIEKGLRDFVATYKSRGITSVAFSKLGCGKGGLEWADVKPLMEKYLSDIDAEVIICLDSMAVPEGKEKEMVDAYNRASLDTIADNIRLSSKQISILEGAKPIRRFFELEKAVGIGAVTYEKLFRLFYDKKKPLYGEQLTLF